MTHPKTHRFSFVAVLVLLICGQTGIARAQDRRERKPRAPQQNYTIEQAISENAQLHTIAFNGLAFVTGDFGTSTFLPPGKVCDFFGFQYMRDIDATGAGHNPKFLNRVAGNVLYELNDDQRAILATLAKEQAPQLNDLAMTRLPLIKAFCRNLSGDIPNGSSGLNNQSVVSYLAELFARDAELSYRRAQVFGRITTSLTPDQKAYFAKMKFGDFTTWPDVDSASYRMPRGTDKLINVAYMTYASEWFSWYAGSIEADTYFCPERHGTYFGGFYMKDMPAMGKRDFDISTSVTGDSGKAFLDLLSDEQREHIQSIPSIERKAIREMVDIRRAISTELRKFMNNQMPDHDKVIALGKRYGELDGEFSYQCAAGFAKVGQSLTNDQRRQCMRLRNLDGYKSAPAYVFSTPLSADVKLPNTDHFFADPKKEDRSDK